MSSIGLVGVFGCSSRPVEDFSWEFRTLGMAAFLAAYLSLYSSCWRLKSATSSGT